MPCDFCLNCPGRVAELIWPDSSCLWSTLGLERRCRLGSEPPSCRLLHGHQGTFQILLQQRTCSGMSIT